MRGLDLGQALEVPLAHLLAPAGLGHLHHLDPLRVVKVGRGRVIEGDVTILADPPDHQIQWMRSQQGQRGSIVEDATLGAVRVDVHQAGCDQPPAHVDPRDSVF